jgi:hypothetical protein
LFPKPGFPNVEASSSSLGTVVSLDGKIIPEGYYQLYADDGEILGVKNLGLNQWTILASRSKSGTNDSAPAIHLPLSVSCAALRSLECHPLLCMLLKVRFQVFSIPSAFTIFQCFSSAAIRLQSVKRESGS